MAAMDVIEQTTEVLGRVERALERITEVLCGPVTTGVAAQADPRPPGGMINRLDTVLDAVRRLDDAAARALELLQSQPESGVRAVRKGE